MIAAVNLPQSLLSDMAVPSAVQPVDDNRESLTSFELVLRAKAGDDRARDVLIASINRACSVGRTAGCRRRRGARTRRTT